MSFSSKTKSGLIVVSILAGLSIWIDFTRFHLHQHGDSLIPILCSLYRWTPFFWAQDRIGMAIPLLATWIKNPAGNLLFQNGISLFLALGMFGLLARFLLHDQDEWIPSAALSVVLIVSLVAVNERFDILAMCQPYTPSLALGLWGLSQVRGRPQSRRDWLDLGLAAVAIALAEWINLAALIPLAPLLVFREGARSRTNVAIGVGLLGCGAVLSALASRAVSMPVTQLEIAPLGEWFQRWADFARACWGNLAPHHWEVGLAVSIGVGTLSLLLPSVRSQARRPGFAAVGLALAGLASFLVMGVLGWVKGNGYAFRYALPTMVLLNSAAASIAVLPLSGLRVKKSGIRLAALGLVALAIAYTYGPPSLDAPGRAFDEKWGRKVQDVLDGKATHVAGNYWTVWPVVFRANWLLYKDHPEYPVYGLAHRTEAIADLVRQVPLERTRVAVFHGDPGTQYLGLLPARGWELVERRRELDIIRPR